jgi:hypothetical protein
MTSATFAEKVVLEELTKMAAKLPPEVRAAFLDGIKRACRKALAGEGSVRKRRRGKLTGLPRGFLKPLGERRTHPADLEQAIKLAAAIFETKRPGFTKRFAGIALQLWAKHPAISAAMDWTDFTAFMAEHEGKVLPRKRFENFERRFAGQASEDVALGHPQVLAEIEAKRQEMQELAADPGRLAQLGLASLDPTPGIHVKIHAPPSKGPPEGRYKYIDFAVVFPGVPLGDAKATRQVVGIAGQVKLWLTQQLVRHLDEWGREQVGQLNKDEIRRHLQGAWRFEEIRIPREEIIDDPRLRTLLTVGSQDYTDAERAQLAKDGIAVTHIVHDVPYGEFYDFAHTAMKLLRITMAP